MRPDHAAFLRAINVGGRRITNDALRAHLEAIGLDDVGIFRASGNVVFSAPAGESPPALTERIERELAGALGYDVGIYLRSAAETRAIAAAEPFGTATLAASKGKLQVIFLLGPLDPEALALATPGDRLVLGERELYWLPSGGFMESELDLKALADLTGPVTIRTKGTVEHVARKYFTS